MNHLPSVQETVKVLKQLMVIANLIFVSDQLTTLSLISAITDLKSAFQKLDDRVRVLEGKSPNVSIYY